MTVHRRVVPHEITTLDDSQEADDETWDHVPQKIESGSNSVNFSEQIESTRSRFIQELADRSMAHRFNTVRHTESLPSTFFGSKIDVLKFEDFCIDNDDQKRCGGFKAYMRYCDYTRTPIGLTPIHQSFRLGDIVHHSLRSTVIRLLRDSAGNYLEYEQIIWMLISQFRSD